MSAELPMSAEPPMSAELPMSAEPQMSGGLLMSEVLASVRLAALEAFPEPEVARTVEWYVRELSQMMHVTVSDAPLDAAACRAVATSEATGESPLTLLCKMEDYLEAVLAGRLAAGKPERSRGT